MYVGVGARERKGLYLVDAAGPPAPTRIPLALPSAYYDPVFSPDGSRIVFACCSTRYLPDGNWLYLVALTAAA